MANFKNRHLYIDPVTLERAEALREWSSASLSAIARAALNHFANAVADARRRGGDAELKIRDAIIDHSVSR